ncbi:MAG TPA: nitroreductase/quinone reductase family protein [Actinopolymorphaceae bacterium]|nr:nitroreductase/quinone reductase family protein [Actinopolymorphaceae bacterium]
MATDFQNALKDTNEIEIAVTGRRSGREISLPVWFVTDHDKLYLMPVTGSDSQWFKNVRKARTLRLSAKGKPFRTSVTPITDAATVRTTVDKFRRKYGAAQVETYYTEPDVAVEVPLT